MHFSGRIIRTPGFWLALVIIGTILLAYLSLIKAPMIQIGPDVRNRFVHFLAYFVYALALACWRITSRPGNSGVRIFAGAFIPSAVYGLILEWLQMYLPHRDSDPFDGICNVLGALIGVAVALALREFTAGDDHNRAE